MGSDLWVQITKFIVTLVNEDTNSVPTDGANRGNIWRLRNENDANYASSKQVQYNPSFRFDSLGLLLKKINIG